MFLGYYYCILIEKEGKLYTLKFYFLSFEDIFHLSYFYILLRTSILQWMRLRWNPNRWFGVARIYKNITQRVIFHTIDTSSSFLLSWLSTKIFPNSQTETLYHKANHELLWVIYLNGIFVWRSQALDFAVIRYYWSLSSIYHIESNATITVISSLPTGWIHERLLMDGRYMDVMICVMCIYGKINELVISIYGKKNSWKPLNQRAVIFFVTTDK